MVSLPAPGPAPAWLKFQVQCTPTIHMPQVHLVTPCQWCECATRVTLQWCVHLVTTCQWCVCATRDTLQWCVLSNVWGISLGIIQGYFQVCHPPPHFRGGGDICLMYLPNISIIITNYCENIKTSISSPFHFHVITKPIWRQLAKNHDTPVTNVNTKPQTKQIWRIILRLLAQSWKKVIDLH